MENPAFIIPEFLAFFVGMLVTFLSWMLYFALSKKSSHLLILQNNLQKIGYAWSTNNGEAIPFEKFNPEKEKIKTLYSYGILVAIMSVLSWLGLIFSVVLMLSIRLLPTRYEKRVFASELASNPVLEPDRISGILREISN